MTKKGLSLLEIIISTIILALVMTGMINVFAAGKKHILHSRYRMAGAEAGKAFLDSLQSDVRQDRWAYNGLGTNNQPSGTSGAYTASYNITDLSPTIKKVKTTVRWNE